VNKEVLSKNTIKIILFIIALVFLDFYTKELALNNLDKFQPKETFFPLIDLLLIYNSGIAFGIFNDQGIYASYFLLILTLLIYKEKDFKKKIALSFITGGAFGNILDRINDGKVTDFLHLKVMDFSFFVFNLADLFITIGAILIIYFEIIYRIKDD
jgi:signal peptidase II